MFDPPTADEIFADVAEAVRHFGHIQPHAVPWLSVKLSELWHSNPDETLLRRCPEGFADLTESGLALGFQALGPTIRRAVNRWRHADEYSKCRRDLACQFYFTAATIRTEPPRVCCAAALNLSGVMFRTGQSLPPLPLANCDLDFCGCDYRIFSHGQFEREGRSGS